MAAYSPRVLIGNWNEDAYLEEDHLRDFLGKKERGELLSQRISKLGDNLLKKTQLSVAKDGFVHFGDTVMLLSPENKSSVENYPGLTLAINMDESCIYSLETLKAPCGVSAIKSVEPVGRNSFSILSVDGAAEGEPLKFGQNFGIGTTGGFSDLMFYLASDHKSFLRFAKKSYLQQVYLTDKLSYLTCWQAVFCDPQMRMEYEGFPVPANSKIIITHRHTNRGLAVPRNFCTRSYFGKEYEVNCHTYLDSHKAEEDKNYWEIITGDPGARNSTMIHRPSPQPGGFRKKEFCEET